MKPTRLIQTLVVALAAVALTGCLDNEQNKIYGELQAKPQSIVSLSPSSTEVIARWGPFGQLKGKTASCDWPEFLTNVPVVVDQTKPNFEKIVAMNADLVVYDPQLFNADDVAKIEQLGIKTLVWDPKSIDDMLEQLIRMGTATGAETKTSEYADLIHFARQRAQAEAHDPRPRVALILPGEGGEHMIVGVGSFQADALRAAGGEPVGPDSDRFVTLNAEALVAQNPDVILVAGDRAAVANDPRLASTAAVRSGKVSQITVEPAVRRGGRVDLFITAVSALLRSK